MCVSSLKVQRVLVVVDNLKFKLGFCGSSTFEIAHAIYAVLAAWQRFVARLGTPASG